MSKFDFNKLNEQFKEIVRNIGNSTVNYIDENLQPLEISDEEDYYGELYYIKKQIDDLHLSKREINSQFISYNKYRNSYYSPLIPNNLLSTGLKESIDTILPPLSNIGLNNVQASDSAMNHLRSMFFLSKWQIQYKNPEFNHIKTPTVLMPYWAQESFVAIPADINDNINYVIYEMKKAGYYCSKKLRIDIQDKPFAMLEFNPVKQDNINDFIRKNCKRLYHCSPIFNKETIRKNGFIPDSKSPAFDYPPRIFFAVDDIIHHREIYNEYIELMNAIALSHRNDDNFTSKYILYEIAVHKIPVGVKFYADPNAKNCCYAIEPIPYSAVIDEEEIVLN